LDRRLGGPQRCRSLAFLFILNVSIARHLVLTEQESLFSAVYNSSHEVEVILRLMVSQLVCLGIEYSCGTCDQILLPVGMLLSEIWGLVSVGCPL
jgi:hypothetical protein